MVENNIVGYLLAVLDGNKTFSKDIASDCKLGQVLQACPNEKIVNGLNIQKELFIKSYSIANIKAYTLDAFEESPSGEIIFNDYLAPMRAKVSKESESGKEVRAWSGKIELDPYMQVKQSVVIIGVRGEMPEVKNAITSLIAELPLAEKMLYSRVVFENNIIKVHADEEFPETEQPSIEVSATTA